MVQLNYSLIVEKATHACIVSYMWRDFYSSIQSRVCGFLTLMTLHIVFVQPILVPSNPLFLVLLQFV